MIKNDELNFELCFTLIMNTSYEEGEILFSTNF